MDREAERLIPSPGAYGSVLARVRRRERRRRGLAAMVALVVAVAGGTGAWFGLRSTRHHVPAGVHVRQNGPLLFTGTGPDRLMRIVRIDAEGSGLSVVVRGREASTSSVSISPDGRLITYIGRGGSQIRVVGIDGTRDRALVPPVQVPNGYTSATHVDGWSPDGNRVLFERNNDIYTVEVDTGRVSVLTHTPEPIRILVDNMGAPVTRPSSRVDADAAWSPDGRSIAFVRGGALFVMRPDGSGAHQVARLADRMVRHPVWSPDAKVVAFSTVKLGGTYPLGCGQAGGIYTVQSSGSAVRRLTADVCDDEVSWSPDGHRLVFETGRGIDVIGADGSARTTLADRAQLPVWSPDGREIAYLGQARGLYIRRLDGSPPRGLPTPGFTIEQNVIAWAPAPSPSPGA
jgi:Tol biopolymer transport system component